jgi:pimeloyl-ACP methyl ester carboxylesterase
LDPSASRYTINENTDELIKEAESLMAGGKPRQLMLLPTWWYVISARTFLDRLVNVPNLVENAKRIRCPVLFVRGDQEPVANYPAEDFKKNCPSPCEIAIIPNCDHFYVGAEAQVAQTVTAWLSQTLT